MSSSSSKVYLSICLSVYLSTFPLLDPEDEDPKVLRNIPEEQNHQHHRLRHNDGSERRPASACRSDNRRGKTRASDIAREEVT